MRKHSCLLVLAMIVIATVARADTRIGFTSDRSGNGDVYKTRDDGSAPTKITDESGAAENPTIAPGGKWVIYNVGGAIYLRDFASPISTPVTLTSTGYDPNAGPYINTARDFRILYTVGDNGVKRIHMATVDISVPELIDDVVLTPAPSGGQDLDNEQPAFCGSNHFVWSHDDSYASEICYQEFNASGPVGTKTCWFSGLTDGADEHPACDSTGTYIAWARESSAYAGTHDIWRMNADGSGTPQSISSHPTDETMPVWAPGDAQIAFAWNYSNSDSSTDYEIWKMNWDDGSGKTQITDNAYEDHAPTWGPAILQ